MGNIGNMGMQSVRSRNEHTGMGEHNHMTNRHQSGTLPNITNMTTRQQIYKCCFCSSQFVYPNSVITHCEQVSHKSLRNTITSLPMSH